MTTARRLRIEEALEMVRDQLDPRLLGEAKVAHYSIPAYDETGHPAIVSGNAIASIKTKVPPHAILLSKLNPRIPRIWLPGASKWPQVCSTEFLVLKPRAGVDRNYIAAVLQHSALTRRFASLATGTSGSHQRARASDVLGLEISLPSLERQQMVGGLIADIDRKIELGKQLLGFLFESARTYWSLVRGYVESTTALEDVAVVSRGISYRSEQLGESSVGLASLKSFGRTGEFRTDGFKGFLGPVDPADEIQAGDLVLALTDVTQKGDVVGQPLLVLPTFDYQRLACTADVAVLRPKRGLSQLMIYAALRDADFQRKARSVAHGTTVLHLPLAWVRSFPLSMPNAEHIKRASPVFEQIATAITTRHRLNVRLSRLRQQIVEGLAAPEGP